MRFQLSTGKIEKSEKLSFENINFAKLRKNKFFLIEFWYIKLDKEKSLKKKTQIFQILENRFILSKID